MRYPFAPVEAFIAGTDGDAARELGVSIRTIQRWKNGDLDRDRAEQVADALRVHPYELWPAMRDHDLSILEVECAAPDCPERFDPQAWSTKRRRYCSRTCQTRVNKRRQRQQAKVLRTV